MDRLTGIRVPVFRYPIVLTEKMRELKCANPLSTIGSTALGTPAKAKLISAKSAVSIGAYTERLLMAVWLIPVFRADATHTP